MAKKSLSHHQALIYVMVTMSAVDRAMTDAEIARIGSLVSHLPIFRDYDTEELVHDAEACGEVLSKEGSLETVLNMIKAALPVRLRETGYALAVEIAAADLDVRQEELRFLEILRDKLEISKLVVSAIERGARARHRTL